MSIDAGSTAGVGDHAVVMGASLAGLATAATLADRFDRVTIVERDALPVVGESRHGVPQASHAHILLPAGMQELAALLPGFLADLRRHGAHVIDAAEIRFYLGGGRLAVDDTDLAVSGATRPLLEGTVRELVRALPGVRFVENCDVIGLANSSEGTRVTGVRIRPRAGDSSAETIDAALVVDATGRASRSLTPSSRSTRWWPDRSGSCTRASPSACSAVGDERWTTASSSFHSCVEPAGTTSAVIRKGSRRSRCWRSPGR